MAIVTISFVIMLTGILGAYWLFVIRPEEQVQQAFWKRLKGKRETVRTASKLLKKARQLSSVPTFDATLMRSRNVVRPLELLIEQSGNRITVGTFLLTAATCGALVAYITLKLSGMLLLAIGAGALAAWVPVRILQFQRTRRVLKFEEQFPEALALVSRALKAGHTFTTGLAMVAEEMPSPIGPEFRLLYDQQNYGMPIGDALKEFAQRVPLLDARFFVTAVLIQRESGGNLSEILDNIATVIRDRFRVKRQIRVVSAHARMTGFVLIGVPPALAFMLFLLNPDHFGVLTGTPLGVNLIWAAITLQVVGSLIIRKMIQLEY
ncbi:MAG TPA: type II secretion system F family protein [Vicinamibacterales bacterium]|jgi:tight adherence protein B|nr:type II secretion system F family protein [Vicinamibacterales bacterium]